MTTFAREFLLEKAGEGVKQGHLALFGKHPGWDDHIEDFSTPTASLALAKQLLYVQGIGGQVSSGAWARLQAASQIVDFDHAILWRRGSQFIVGRLWASSDGKRRVHFPMVVLVHCTGLPLEASMPSILSWLETIEAACKGTQSAEAVRDLVAQCQIDFQRWVSETDFGQDDTPPSGEGDVSQEERERLFRSVQQLYHPLRRFVAGSVKSRGEMGSAHVRLPASGNQTESLRFCALLLAHVLDFNVPVFLAVTRESGWIDVVAGEPQSPDFFCLRANRDALPVRFATEESDSRETERIREIVDSFLSPRDPEDAAASAPSGSWLTRLFQRGE